MAAIIFLSFTGSAFAQVPDTVWSKLYGGRDHDVPWSISKAADKGYIIVGATMSYGLPGNWNVFLVRITENGDTIWTNSYSKNRYNVGYSVQETFDGGYIVAGASINDSDWVTDVYLVKTNIRGDSLWAKSYGTPYISDWGFSVLETFDCGFIVAGFCYNPDSSSEDIYILRTDMYGDSLWSRKYGGQGRDHAYHIENASDGGYVLTGSVNSFGNGDGDAFLMKIDEVGNCQWLKTYGGSWFEEFRWVEKRQQNWENG